VLIPAGWACAGNAFKNYGSRLPAGSSDLEALPTASALLRLAPALLGAGLAGRADLALPLYVRDKVASTTAERMAQREAERAAKALTA
jgi:tRNA threonylcarbamoyladenosine biosynthesis protein TsaB